MEINSFLQTNLKDFVVSVEAGSMLSVPSLSLKDGDYKFTPVRMLRKEGKLKLAHLRNILFDSRPRIDFPLSEENLNELMDIANPQVILVPPELAFEAFARRFRGNVCELDNLPQIKQWDPVPAILVSDHVDEKGNFKLMLRDWSLVSAFTSESTYVYDHEKAEMVSVLVNGDPITVGPIISLSKETLLTGKSDQSWNEWANNFVRYWGGKIASGLASKK